MEKRQLISAITLSAAVFVLWTLFQLWYQKHYPAPPPGSVSTETQPALPAPTVAVPSTNAASTQASTEPATLPTITAGLHVVPATQPSSALVLLGSANKDDPNYVMQLALTADGAGILDSTLNQFPSPDSGSLKKSEKKPYIFEEEIAGHPRTRSLATRTLVINDAPVDLGSVPWKLVSSDAGSATFSVQIADSSGPLAEIIKTYRLPTRQATKDTSLGYEIAVEQSIRSLQPGKTLRVREVINGPTPPPSELEQGTDRSVIVGYDEAAKGIGITQRLFGEFKGDKATQDLTNKDDKHFAWAGQFSSYFGAIVQPDAAQESLFTVRGEALEPSNDDDHKVALTFETSELSATSDSPAKVGMSVYLGPKWRDVLNTSYYTTSPRMYDQVLIIKGGLCGVCTFAPLIKALVWVLGIFHSIFRDWGLAIICLVLCVRAVLHPLTKKSQVQMMKMGKLAPEVEKLKKKYADQPDVLNKEMMQLYKQQGGAMLGCLPMFLQTPIWIALWTALQGTFELRQAPFLYGWTWIRDLAKPDSLVSFHGAYKILFFTLYGLNILPILMAAVTYINQKYFMPMPIAATPEQESQQKMQRGMSLIFPLMFYNLPSGLNIYYLTSMSLGILESKIIRDHIKEREAAEKEGRVFVTTKATRGARRRDGKDNDVPEKPGLIARFMMFMEQAQQRAEQMRKDSQKGDGKKRKN